MRMLLLRLAILLAVIPTLSACLSSRPGASSVIKDADLVPRSEACRALAYPRIPKESPPDLINYVVALDAAHQTFCNPKGH